MATEQTTAPAGQALLRKLTLRTFIGTKGDILAAAQTGKTAGQLTGSKVPILRVIGHVNGYKADQSDYGQYIELRGAFHGTNLLTGEVIENCTRAILPEVVGEAVATAIRDGAESAEFAVEIDVQYDEAAATMYKFSVRTLLPPAVAKPVSDLMGRMEKMGLKMTAPKRIEAPKASAEDLARQAAASKKADEERAGKSGAANEPKQKAKA